MPDSRSNLLSKPSYFNQGLAMDTQGNPMGMFQDSYCSRCLAHLTQVAGGQSARTETKSLA